MKKADGIIEDLGQRIAEARRERGWTQVELAHRIGIEPQSLQRIERGATNVTIRRIIEIAELLGVPMLSLFDAPASRDRKPGRPKKP